MVGWILFTFDIQKYMQRREWKLQLQKYGPPPQKKHKIMIL
jgi:hypothetical protein